MTKSDDRGVSRRELLSVGARWSVGAAGLLALDKLGLVGQAAAQGGGGGYKALVCVFLYGGNDSLNLIAPRSPAEYNVYAASRQNLAVPLNQLLSIPTVTAGGVLWGLHPSVTHLRALYNDGRLGVVGNVGTLVRPLTKAQYQAPGSQKPPQLFSHSDQQFQWQTGVADQLDNIGWAGRMADTMAGVNGASPLSLNLSLSGANTLQIGQSSLPYSLGTNGPVALNGLFQGWNARRTQAFTALLGQAHTHVMERQYAEIQNQAIEIRQLIASSLAAAPPLATAFPDTHLGRQLKMVARMIALRQTLGVTRQVFFVSTGGFDTHDDQNADQPVLFANLSASLGAFQTAMEELDTENDVTAFTGSDFGRTLTSNGDGTDHGWGGHHFVLGGAVSGGQIFGTMPNFAIGGPDDVGGGRLLPTTSVDQYSATLARWFGVPEPTLATLFPNLENFPTSDLGFFD